MKKLLSIVFSVLVLFSLILTAEYLLDESLMINNQSKYAAIPPVKLPPVPPPDQR